MTFEFLTVSVSSIFYFCNLQQLLGFLQPKIVQQEKKKKVRMFAFLSVGVSSIFHFCNLKQPKTLLVS